MDTQKKFLHMIKPKYRAMFPKDKVGVESHPDRVLIVVNVKPEDFFVDEKN